MNSRIQSLIYLLLTSLLFACLIPQAFARDLDLTETERAWISDHPTLRASNEQNYPPFNFNTDGQPRRYLIELMGLLAPGSRKAVYGNDWEFSRAVLPFA
jgi:hypothetical protein